MPRPKNTKPRISDPYWDKNRGQWRLIIRQGTGKEERLRFESEAAAHAYAEEWRLALADTDITVEEALSQYKDSQVRRELRASTIATAQFRCRVVLASCLDLPVRNLTTSKVAACYQAYKRAATTRRSALVELVGFAKYVVDAELGINFTEGIVFEGKIAKGKPQLRVTQAQIFSEAALRLYREGDEAGLAVLLALTLGVRTSEVVNRLVEDVDDEGRLLWIPYAKTGAGIRKIIVPPFLAELLRQQIEGKRPADRLFTHRGHAYVRDASKRLCRSVGLREITGQGLRGTFATLTIEDGCAPDIAARVMGHADAGITTSGSYAKIGAVQSGGAKRMAGLLQNDTNNQDQSRTKGETVPNRNSSVQ